MQHEQYHLGNGAAPGGAPIDARLDARLGALAATRVSAPLVAAELPVPPAWERAGDRLVLDAEHVPSDQLWRAAIRAAAEAAALAAELRQQLTAAAKADALARPLR